MRRSVTASALLAAVCAAAWSQTPPAGKAAPAPNPVPHPTTLEGQIAAALLHDSDVRMARAKIQLAEAELAKARQQVAQKVTALNSALDEARQAVAGAEEEYAMVNQGFQKGIAPIAEVLPRRQRLEAAKARFAAVQSELKFLVGGGPGAAPAAPADPLHAAAQAVQCSACHAVPGAAGVAPAGRPLTPQENLRKWLSGSSAPPPPAGPVPARIRAALDAPVRLGAKGDKVPLDKALAAFKKAGLDVPVRPMPSPVPEVTTDGEELPVGAWLQLYQDVGTGNVGGGYVFFVREYGLLVSTKQSGPPDAQTVTEFWRTKAGSAK